MKYINGIEFREEVDTLREKGYIIEGWRGGEYRPCVRGRMDIFPGSQQLWVSSQLEVREEHRRQGISKSYNKYVTEHFIRDLGQNARAIIATVHINNTAQQERLRKLDGWHRISNTLWLWKRQGWDRDPFAEEAESALLTQVLNGTLGHEGDGCNENTDTEVAV